MRKIEEAAVVRLLRKVNEMQRQIQKPTVEDATDEEVVTLFKLLWRWTPTPRYDLPSKHVVEKLVGWLRGCEGPDYCYISRQDVARIIRAAAKDSKSSLSVVYLNPDAGEMDDTKLYSQGKWNFKPTPLVDLLFNVYANPRLFDRDGNRW